MKLRVISYAGTVGLLTATRSPYVTTSKAWMSILKPSLVELLGDQLVDALDVARYGFG